ncbi:magnesium/cobalt transporter CorA [Cytobacillus spongiae]|uniref:magnesium/cobalt transporter CorA n=1 Tax=Cytobacillus spongiae TaxID=2901381 RepID=UPI001F300EFF|nr:magnesium/cobalt transporter CorA [Cytobacillus spongiae]UII54406.1 magnesium/cobalt transporter CorA [Cytobacillus spongiae]
MIRTLAITDTYQFRRDIPLSELSQSDVKWYWVDFFEPTQEEITLLTDPFHFHPLAIEDCVQILQRPKLDYYEKNTFFVTHGLHAETLEKEEVNFFIGDHYIVTFHYHNAKEVNEVWQRIAWAEQLEEWDPYLILYHIIDKMVDNYFPIVYRLEDKLNDIEDHSKRSSMEELLEDLYDTRHDLLTLRHTIAPMRDLVYRMLNSHHLVGIRERREYFSDIYDHLLKLSEMVDANREITADIRDSYLSLNAHQTNRVMKVLTVITTIFMPLTFIAGLYGMNFENMPELSWDYGYFIVLALMMIIGGWMFLWFKQKGWFK